MHIAAGFEVCTTSYTGFRGYVYPVVFCGRIINQVLFPQVSAAVATVISAFHGAAAFVSNAKRRRSHIHPDSVTNEEKDLQISLETAELQLGFRFSTEEARFGDIVRVGDGLSRLVLRSP